MAENNTEVTKVAINDIGTEEDFIKAVDSTIKNFDDGDPVSYTHLLVHCSVSVRTRMVPECMASICCKKLWRIWHPTGIRRHRPRWR